MENVKKYWWAYALGLIVLFVLFAPKKWYPQNLFVNVTGTADGTACTTSAATGSKPGAYKGGVCVANA